MTTPAAYHDPDDMPPDMRAAYHLMLDAGRSAIALLRAYRAGDTLAGAHLMATLEPHEQLNLIEAVLALANQAFNAVDHVSNYAREHGAPELTTSADSVLATIALGFASLPDGQHD